MENNEQEILAISATPEEVGAMLFEISTSRPEISSFLESVGPQTALTFCAWFCGQLIAQDPNMGPAFKQALDVGVQVAAVMREQHAKDNPGFEHDGAFLILYPPSPSNESQLSFSDSTGFIQ